MVVHVSAEVLAGMGDVPAGTPRAGVGAFPRERATSKDLVSRAVATARRLACDGKVAPAVIGADGECWRWVGRRGGGRREAQRQALRSGRGDLRIRGGRAVRRGCPPRGAVVGGRCGPGQPAQPVPPPPHRRSTRARMTLTRENGRWVFPPTDQRSKLDPPHPGRPRLETHHRFESVFPPHGRRGFTLDACVTALFHCRRLRTQAAGCRIGGQKYGWAVAGQFLPVLTNDESCTT